MLFRPTKIEGVQLVEAQPVHDERGFFARYFCPVEMAAAGIDFEPKQTSLSRNDMVHTLRGLHYTTEPESKFVRCVRGRIFDVAVDLRRESPSFGQWIGVELDAISGNALFIPSGIAHGFLSLEADTDVLYQIDRLYRPGYEVGIMWNDPSFGIVWPTEPKVISARDRAYAPFKDANTDASGL